MKTKIIDLTLSINPKMKVFPSYWHPKVEITKLGHLKTEGRSTRRIVLGSHTGTHVDAPTHFISKGYSIDKLSLDILIGPATVLNLANSKPAYEITPEDLKHSIGDRPTKRLILRTDWSEKFKSPHYYTHYPFLSKKAAIWLVKKGLRLLAMDTPSPDNPLHCRGSSEDSPNHKLFLRRGVILVEYLCNLKVITKRRVELIVLPMKIEDSDGSPARCVAIEKGDSGG